MSNDPWCTTTCEQYRATGLMQLLRKLAASLAAANDQHRSRRQLIRIAIVLREDLMQARRQLRRSCGQVRALVSTGRDDHFLRAELAPWKRQHEILSILLQ